MRDGAEVRHEAVAALRADSVVSQPQHRHVRAEIGDVEERRQCHRTLVADVVAREVQSGQTPISASTPALPMQLPGRQMHSRLGQAPMTRRSQMHRQFFSVTREPLSSSIGFMVKLFRQVKQGVLKQWKSAS